MKKSGEESIEKGEFGKIKKNPAEKYCIYCIYCTPQRTHCVSERGSGSKRGGKKSVWGMGRMEVKRYGTELYPTR